MLSLPLPYFFVSTIVPLTKTVLLLQNVGFKGGAIAKIIQYCDVLQLAQLCSSYSEQSQRLLTMFAGHYLRSTITSTFFSCHTITEPGT